MENRALNVYVNAFYFYYFATEGPPLLRLD